MGGQGSPYFYSSAFPFNDLTRHYSGQKYKSDNLQKIPVPYPCSVNGKCVFKNVSFPFLPCPLVSAAAWRDTNRICAALILNLTHSLWNINLLYKKDQVHWYNHGLHIKPGKPDTSIFIGYVWELRVSLVTCHLSLVTHFPLTAPHCSMWTMSGLAPHCDAEGCSARFSVRCNVTCTVQCCAVQCTAVQCCAVQCSAVQCSAVQFSAAQCSAVQCSSVQRSAMQCSVVQ